MIGLNKVNRVVWIKDKGKIRQSACFFFLYHTIGSAKVDQSMLDIRYNRQFLLLFVSASCNKLDAHGNIT